MSCLACEGFEVLLAPGLQGPDFGNSFRKIRHCNRTGNRRKSRASFK
jgi:hypothetical protein